MKQPSIAQLQRDVYAFWKTHGGKKAKSYTIERKNELATAFIEEQHAIWDEHLEAIREQMKDGKTPVITLMDMKVKHPEHRNGTRSANVYEIVADFIATIDDAIVEDVKKYPVYSTAQELSRSKTRMKHEIAIFDIDSDDDDARHPFGTVSSDDVSQQLANRPEYIDVTKEHMYEVIDDYKANIDEIVPELLKMKECTLDRRSLRRKIRDLSYDNVKECVECGQVFYAKDKRTEVCDLTIKHIVKDGVLIATKYSDCWQKRNTKKTRRNKWRCAI